MFLLERDHPAIAAEEHTTYLASLDLCRFKLLPNELSFPFFVLSIMAKCLYAFLVHDVLLLDVNINFIGHQSPVRF